jgi:hypothetical protein
LFCIDDATVEYIYKYLGQSPLLCSNLSYLFVSKTLASFVACFDLFL